MRTCSNISSLPVTLIIGWRSASVTLSSQQCFRDATGTRNFRNIHGTFFSVLLHSHVSLDGFVQPRLSHFLHPRPLPALIGPTQKAQSFLCCHLVVRSPPAISEFSFLSFFFVPPTRINHVKCLFFFQRFSLVLVSSTPPVITFSNGTEPYMVHFLITYLLTSGTRPD